MQDGRIRKPTAENDQIFSIFAGVDNYVVLPVLRRTCLYLNIFIFVLISENRPCDQDFPG